MIKKNNQRNIRNLHEIQHTSLRKHSHYFYSVAGAYFSVSCRTYRIALSRRYETIYPFIHAPAMPVAVIPRTVLVTTPNLILAALAAVTQFFQAYYAIPVPAAAPKVETKKGSASSSPESMQQEFGRAMALQARFVLTGSNRYRFVHLWCNRTLFRHEQLRDAPTRTACAPFPALSQNRNSACSVITDCTPRANYLFCF